MVFDRSKKIFEADEVELKKGAGKVKERDPLTEVSGIKMPDLDAHLEGNSFGKEMFAQIPIKVTVQLGQTNLSLKEVLSLKEGSIIELNRIAGEPLDLVINDQLIARGEVVAIDDNYGLRITDVIAR